MHISKKNNFIKMCNRVLLIIYIVSVSFIYTACDKIESPITEAETYAVPKAINQHALDKETETATIEATKANHIYPEDFVVNPEKEVPIRAEHFLTAINYIKNHMDAFSKSTIVIEGMYGKYTSWDETFSFPMVYRNGPACCGDDQYGGFFLVNIDESQVKLDDWIQVRGKPFNYEHTDSEGEVFNYPFILVESLRVLPTRDREAEMVND